MQGSNRVFVQQHEQYSGVIQKSSVLIIAYYFDPNNAVGALRSRRFHRYLGELGYDSQVIAAIVDPREQFRNVFHVPDHVDQLFETRVEAVAAGLPIPRMSLPAHVERVIRKLFLPRHAGLAWSRIAAAFAKTLIEP